MNKRLTFDEVVTRSKEIHGDKYTYLKMSMIVRGRKQMPRLDYECHRCKTVQHQNVTDHLHGYGCKCTGEYIFDEVAEQGSVIHNNQYEYVKLHQATNRRSRAADRLHLIEYICKKTGLTNMQPASSHIRNKKGCLCCRSDKQSGSMRISFDDVIRRAKIVRGDTCEHIRLYKPDGNKSRRVVFVCKSCNTVQDQMLTAHLSGSGCKECHRRIRIGMTYHMHNPRIPKSFEGIVAAARVAHGNKYEYLEVFSEPNKSSGAIRRIKYRCTICGYNNNQRLYSHISVKCGCAQCASQVRAEANRMSFDDFVVRANHVHKNKYEYLELLMSYVDDRGKSIGRMVKYICRGCNKEMTQSLSAHLSGHGCQCLTISNSALRKNKRRNNIIPNVGESMSGNVTE